MTIDTSCIHGMDSLHRAFPVSCAPGRESAVRQTLGKGLLVKRKAKVLHLCCGNPYLCRGLDTENPSASHHINAIIESSHGLTLPGPTDSVLGLRPSALLVFGSQSRPRHKLSSSALLVRNLDEHVNGINLNGLGASYVLLLTRLTRTFTLLATGFASHHSL